MRLLDDYVVVTLTRDEYRERYQGGILLPDCRSKRVQLRDWGSVTIDKVYPDGARDVIVPKERLQ